MKKIFFFIFLLLASPVYATLSEGLGGWWKMDEGSGNNKDSSGNVNTGTPTALTAVANCLRNKCYSFDGATSKISITDATSINPTSLMSVAAWINPVTAGGGGRGRIADKRAGGANGFEFFVDDGTSLCSGSTNAITFSFDGNAAHLACSGNGTITYNAWQHVAATYDGTNVRLYVNGVLKTTTALANALGGNGTLAIGARANAADRQFNGSIDDVRLYTRTLSASEVADLYKSGAVVKGAGTIGSGYLSQ